MLDNKALSIGLVLAVNFTDIFHKTGRHVYYTLFFVLCPALCFLTHKLTSPLDAEQRKKFTKFCGVVMIAVAAWALSFTGRLINGDLSKSALSDSAGGITAALNSILASQQSADKKLDKIDTALNAGLEASREKTAAQAREKIKDARKFAKAISEDGINHTPAEYEKIIANCEESLDRLNALEPLDDELYTLIADLHLVTADIYQLWAPRVLSFSLSRYESAIGHLEKVADIREHIPDDRLAEAYVSIGSLYILEGDTRQKSKMLEKADKYFRMASRILEGTSPSLQIIYYSSFGSLRAAQSENLPPGERAAKEKYLKESISSFEKAKKLASAASDTGVGTKGAILKESAMATREFIALKLKEENHNAEELGKLCLDTISEIQGFIEGLDKETDQKALVWLNYQNAGLRLQLFDIVFYIPAFTGMKREETAAKIGECAKILIEAEENLEQAWAFNGDSRYMDSVEILDKRAMATYRSAYFLAGDEKQKAFEATLELYDLILSKVSKGDNLQQNMRAAANKATTLFNAALLLNDEEMINEAVRIAGDYLKQYSSTNYPDTLDTFRNIIDNEGGARKIIKKAREQA